ncbi:hypothetical protein GCM10010431_83730 [Streptomyces kunmingensis]
MTRPRPCSRAPDTRTTSGPRPDSAHTPVPAPHLSDGPHLTTTPRQAPHPSDTPAPHASAAPRVRTEKNP